MALKWFSKILYQVHVQRRAVMCLYNQFPSFSFAPMENILSIAISAVEFRMAIAGISSESYIHVHLCYTMKHALYSLFHRFNLVAQWVKERKFGC